MALITFFCLLKGYNMWQLIKVYSKKGVVASDHEYVSKGFFKDKETAFSQAELALEPYKKQINFLESGRLEIDLGSSLITMMVVEL